MSARRTSWYMIAYRVLTLPLWWPMVWCGRILFTAGSFVVGGPAWAAEAWRDTR